MRPMTLKNARIVVCVSARAVVSMMMILSFALTVRPKMRPSGSLTNDIWKKW